MTVNKLFGRIAVAGALLLATASMAAARTAFVEAESLNLRSGPGIGHPVIAALHGGMAVEVLDCGNGWCYVSSAAGRGFVSEDYLSFGGPVYAAAPPPVYVAPPVVFPRRHYWRKQWQHSRWRDRHWLDGYRRHRW